jgi:LytS/YehU family sensor histidine kinase
MGSTAEFAIANPRFRHFTRINIVGYSEGPINKGVKLNANKPPLLYIQAGKKLYLLSYNENPLWYFRIVIWLAIYLLIYVFLELLQNIQKKRIEARLKTQQQIRELQFKVLTSQLNPHFTFNALNTISSSIYDPEKPEIYDRFTMFSRLIRSILSDSDKVACSLENEVSFTEDFLKIQKLRFKDAFWYEIKIAKNVNRLSLVPKLIIQIFVENAIKHAFPNEYGKDKVEIVVTQKNTDILIEVTDNGLGRKKASEIVKLKTIYSTGVGLRVIQEYIDLLNEQNKNKITITFTDLHSENQAKGTCVRIKIPVRFDYSVK